MRAAVIEVGGPPAALQIAHVADPRPGDTDVLISVSHISIEGGDLAERRNRQGGSPHVIGYAASGTIVEVGRQVTRFKVGQRVTTFASSGSHAELRAAPAATTFLVPDGLDMGVAAAMPCGPGTAALALQLGRLQAGETALITGATGGVGLAAVQLAALAGARVIGAARHRESLARLKHFGLSDAVVSGGISTSDSVRELTDGRGVDLLIDNVGGAVLLDGLRAVADGGRAVMVGVIGGFHTPIDAGHLLQHRLTVTGCFMGAVMGEAGPRQLIEALLRQGAEGRFAMPVAKVFPLSDIAAAHQSAESSGKLGRVIVTVGSH